MAYVDGIIAAVPTVNKEKFKEHAEVVAKIFKEYGALQVVDCWGDEVPDGEVTSLPMAVKCQDDETVCFSWITWPSREVRMEAWEKMMTDSRLKPEEMPFDGKRSIFGGFEVIVES